MPEVGIKISKIFWGAIKTILFHLARWLKW
jgi:hypothetical protein